MATLLLLSTVFLPARALAATQNLVVTTSADDTATAANCTVQAAANTGTDAACSLRDALAAAANGGYTISFSSTVFSTANTAAQNTITLSTPLTVPGSTTIVGPLNGVKPVVTISGGGTANTIPVLETYNSVTGILIENLNIVNGNNSGNSSALITGYGVTATLQNCVLTGHTSSPIFVDYTATVNLIGTTIENNVGTAIFAEAGGTINVTNSTLSGNNGGIGTYGTDITVNVVNSTISNNTASAYGSGAGISNSGTLTVSNSTITGNHAGYYGGGIYNSGTATLTNSIVAGNQADAGYADFDGSYTDGGGNVIGTAAATASQIAIDLMPLGSYGGPTPTQPTLPGSPALCAITPTSTTGTDQRGLPRTTTYGTTLCQDAGAAQSNYTLAFGTKPPAHVNVSQAMKPTPVVQLKESGLLASAATTTVTIADSASLLAGTESEALAKGSASFPNLQLSAITTGDVLTATLPLSSSIDLTAKSEAISAQVAPVLTTPAPSSTLAAGSVTFSWSAGTGVTAYKLALGTTGVGSSDVFLSSALTTTSVTVPNIPGNGVTVFARLSWEVSGTWLSADSVYLETGTVVLPSMTTPAPSSTLTGSSATFVWNAGVGATAFKLAVGTTGVGSSNLASMAASTATSLAVSNIPTNGVTLFVRLSYELNAVWKNIDYTYTEYGTAVLPALTAPVPSSTLSGTSATFQWSAGVGPLAYQLLVGTTGAGSKNVFSSGSTTATSATVSGIPASGVKLYVRLMYQMSGAWKSIDYTYLESGSFTAPALVSPAPSSTLSGTSGTFTWNPGAGATAFQLLLGQNGVGASDVYNSGSTTKTSVTVSTLPANGVNLYARLKYEVNGAWQSLDYVFTESGAFVAPALTVPTPGSTLTGSSEGFAWSAGGGATAYQLLIGTTGVGSKNIYSSGSITALTAVVSKLPTNGSTVYARLMYEKDGAWLSTDSTYTAASGALAESCSGMSLGQNANLNGYVPFPATNVWNTDISALTPDPMSATIVSAAGFAGNHLHPDFSSVAGGNYGIPYVVVDSALPATNTNYVPFVPIDVIDYATESDVMNAPFPTTTPLEGTPADCSGWPDEYLEDAHAIVLDRGTCMMYETFNTHRCPNGGTTYWAASSETLWDLNNYNSRPYGWTSADAAGLPIFPGLVRYDEIASGAINHAIRFTLPATKDNANGGYFVYPATHAAGNVWGVDNIIGMRIRLKADFDISGFSKTNQIILTAMKKYGMILADSGSYFYFQGVPDARWNDSDLAQLATVYSENFDVMPMTPTYPGYDSTTAPTGSAPTINLFTVSPKTVKVGSPVTLAWNTTNDSYDSYDFIDQLGGVRGGSITVTPGTITTYTLNATNAYGRTTAQVTVNVTGAAPPITWAIPTAITYGTALSAAQLNATAPVAGTFAYSPAAGSVLQAGTQTLTVTFTPKDTTSYKVATAQVQLTVNQALPAITWATPASIPVGTALSATQLNATSPIDGQFTYNPVAGTVLTAGTHSIEAVFTPTDAVDYASSSASVNLTVTPASAAAACSSISLGTNASLNGFVPFPSSNAWNVDISDAAVDPMSATITSAAGFAGNHMHPDFSSLVGGVGGVGYGIPYLVVDSSLPTTNANYAALAPIDVIDYASQSDIMMAPLPPTAPIELAPTDCQGWPTDYINTGSLGSLDYIGDAHVLLIDRATCKLYETYNTHRCTNSGTTYWSASSETLWDLNNYEQRPYGWTSADAAGLPIFPGLVRYDEIAAGAINHAIRFTLPFTKNNANGGYFVDPATHAAGNNWGTENVIGMRIRLKASFDISGFSAVNQIILTAMKKYGMILADNGSYFYFQGTPDARWNDSDLALLAGVKAEDFDVVQMTPTYPGWDANSAPTGAAPTINSFQASSASVAAGTAVTLSWNTTNDSYDFIDLLGGVNGTSISVTPTATTTYTLNATNAYGRSTAQVTVTVH